MIFNPPLPISPDDFYKTLLSVSGVLFGIAFAAMLFVLQSGFSSFKFSRRMFLELYLHFGRQLLYTLAYLTAAPFIVMFFPESSSAVSWLYALYFVYFLNASLDYAKEEGYIITIHSTKFVPRHYGRVRTYFRYIKNRGALRNISFLCPIFMLLVYPYALSIYEGESLRLTKTAIFYSCLIPLLYALYKITKFIPEFFTYTGMELSSNTQNSSEEQSEEEKQQNIVEKRALREYLNNHGVTELSPATPRQFIDGELHVNFLENKESSEAWFNLNINIKNSSPEQIRREVLEYASTLAKLLHASKVGINIFVLSFHIRIATQPSRNMFFRMSRNELDKIFALGNHNPADIAKLKNVLFDELFRQ